MIGGEFEHVAQRERRLDPGLEFGARPLAQLFVDREVRAEHTAQRDARGPGQREDEVRPGRVLVTARVVAHARRHLREVVLAVRDIQDDEVASEASGCHTVLLQECPKALRLSGQVASCSQGM
jgi:hypothetical protein